MGLHKEALSKLLQATIMTVCENTVVFKRNLCVQTVIIIEVDGDKFCSLSFRDDRIARLSDKTAADLPSIGEKLASNVKSEEDEMGIDTNVDQSEINGDVNNMFTEAVRVWYNDSAETGSSFRSSSAWKDFNRTPAEASNESPSAKQLHRCETCGATFTFISNLRRHRKSFHHPQRPLGGSSAAIASVDGTVTNSLTFVSQTSDVGGTNGSGLLKLAESGFAAHSPPLNLYTSVKTEPITISVDDENSGSTSELQLGRSFGHSGSVAADSTASSKQSAVFDETVNNSAFEVYESTTTTATSVGVNKRRTSSTLAPCFKCKFCGENFVLEANLQRHVQFYHDAEKAPSSNIAFGSRSLGENGGGGIVRQASFGEDPTCHICGKTFVSAVDRKRHVSLAHGRLASHRKEQHRATLYDTTLNGSRQHKTVEQHSPMSLSEVITSLASVPLTIQPASLLPVPAKRTSASSQSSSSRRGVPLAKYKFACSICNARFTFQTNVTRHMKNMHKISVSSLGLLHGGDQALSSWRPVATSSRQDSENGGDGGEENSLEHCHQELD